MKRKSGVTNSIKGGMVNAARDAAVNALIEICCGGEELALVDVATDGLEKRDAQLARAIHRTALQRWLTIDSILRERVRINKIEPALRGILVAGTAQLLFMDRLPIHAVVDVAVEQAKRRLRKGAGRLTNAVLRRVTEMIVERHETGGWNQKRGTVPWEKGQIVIGRVKEVNESEIDDYLAFATSHKKEHVQAWRSAFGDKLAVELLVHSLTNAPTIVFAGEDAKDADLKASAHNEDEFVCWEGSYGELVAFLDNGCNRWVQDTTSAKAIADSVKCISNIGDAGDFDVDCKSGLIVDYCAGRGTKTLQLAKLYPKAKIVATDVNAERVTELERVFADNERVNVVTIEDVQRYKEKCDLLLLDVPCSNTGTLARRLEARYRYSQKMLKSVVELQREIVVKAGRLMKKRSVMIYSTCSIESVENEAQVEWIDKELAMRRCKTELTLQGGNGASYHDGGFYAVLKMRD